MKALKSNRPLNSGNRICKQMPSFLKNSLDPDQIIKTLTSVNAVSPRDWDVDAAFGPPGAAVARQP